jgi:hypothetical protein
MTYNVVRGSWIKNWPILISDEFRVKLRGIFFEQVYWKSLFGFAEPKKI